jgi:hypothetical protein
VACRRQRANHWLRSCAPSFYAPACRRGWIGVEVQWRGREEGGLIMEDRCSGRWRHWSSGTESMASPRGEAVCPSESMTPQEPSPSLKSGDLPPCRCLNLEDHNVSRWQSRPHRQIRRGMGRGAPNRFQAPRGRRGSASCFIRLQSAPAALGGRHCEPNFAPTPILAIERQIRSTGGDALTNLGKAILKPFGSCLDSC